MKKRFILLALVLASCGKSPLFNHTDARLNGLESEGGCQLAFEKSGCAAAHFSKPPQTGEEATFELDFWKPDSASDKGPFQDPPGEVRVKLWMVTMGHGSSPVTLNRLSDGRYQVSRAYFTMPGHWQVKVELLKSGQVFDRAQLDVSI
jgi:hypothetical protein